MGFYKNFSRQFEFTVENYYKIMQNQIDYRDGAEINNPDAIESQLLYGRGRAYGMEFLISLIKNPTPAIFIKKEIRKTDRLDKLYIQ